MVLGMDWLRGISQVTLNFQRLTLQFSHGGTNLLLQGTTDNASLRVVGVEILDDVSGMEDP